MKTHALCDRIKAAATRGAPVALTLAEAEALIEVVEAASALFVTTIDRNVGRRRMERLQVALARLDQE